MFYVQFVLLLSSLVQLSTARDEEGNNFVQLYDCTCVGYTQIFECTVFGGGVTVWRGTAFNCQPGQDEIRLRHSQYTSTQTSGECNNGAIVIRSVGVVAGCYTSMLNVTIGEDMINQTVECAYDDLQSDTNTIIGHEVLRIVQVPHAPPSGLHVETIQKDHVIFSWNPVTSRCPSIQYVITSSNCGVCPRTTVGTTVSCNVSSANENRTCKFAVQTELCGTILGNRSEFISLMLTVPKPPKFKLKFQHYASENVTVEIQFNKSTIAISNESVIDGSPTFYTIIYSDFTTGRLCGSFSIQASSCSDGTCLHKFEISPPCSLGRDISVSMSSTNVFGDGPFSDPVVVSFISHTPNQCSDTVMNMGECINTQFGLFLPVSSVLSALVIVVMITVITCTAVNIKLCKDKAKLLKTIRSQSPDVTADRELNTVTASEFYEEIDMYQVSTSTDIEINENRAYSTVKDL